MFLYSALTWGAYCAAAAFLLAGLIYLIVKTYSRAFPAEQQEKRRRTLRHALFTFGPATLLTVGWVIFATYWVDTYDGHSPVWLVFLWFAVPVLLFAAAATAFFLCRRAYKRRKQ